MAIGVCLVLLWAKDPLGSCDTNCITLQLRTQTSNYNIITYSENPLQIITLLIRDLNLYYVTGFDFSFIVDN